MRHLNLDGVARLISHIKELIISSIITHNESPHAHNDKFLATLTEAKEYTNQAIASSITDVLDGEY